LELALSEGLLAALGVFNSFGEAIECTLLLFLFEILSGFNFKLNSFPVVRLTSFLPKN